MKNIWEFRTPVPPHLNEVELQEKCSVLNEEELMKAGYHRWKKFSISDFPVAQLALNVDDFDIDTWFCAGRQFVSEKLRSAMQLGSPGVLYFDVDDSRSSPSVRSKKFKIMEVTARENASDPEKSKYKMFDHRNGRPPTPIPLSITMRQDAAPAHDLFRDHFFMGLFCTDELAVRVLKAGCTGVLFSDPEHSHTRFRTLRGVEEFVGWDRVNHTEITKLVHSIH